MRSDALIYCRPKHLAFVPVLPEIKPETKIENASARLLQLRKDLTGARQDFSKHVKDRTESVKLAKRVIYMAIKEIENIQNQLT